MKIFGADYERESNIYNRAVGGFASLPYISRSYNSHPHTFLVKRHDLSLSYKPQTNNDETHKGMLNYPRYLVKSTWFPVILTVTIVRLTPGKI